jgi:hypothetical protein
MHIVEIGYAPGALAKLMGQMRGWLDDHHSSPRVFSIHAGCCSVEFATESEARDFAAAFDGGGITGPEKQAA